MHQAYAVALATTCRTFCKPALDQLYYALPSIYPVIQCLPQDVWQIRGRENTLFIIKPLEQHHWDTIARYSRRVRSLQVSFDSEDLDTYIALSRAPDPSYLFPSLRVLHWRCRSNYRTDIERMIPFLKFTLRPSLYELSLALSYVALETHVDLHSLGTLCPNLRALDMMFAPASPFKDQLICSCRNLRRVSAAQASEKLFQFLATSPFLDYLSVTLVGVTPDSLQLWRRQCNSPIFPSLRDVDLRVNSVQTATSFLELRLWSIQHITIMLVRSTFDAVTREQLFWLLHDQCDRDRLEHMTIYAGFLSTEDTPVVDVQTFLPLMAFRKLTGLELSSVMVLAIDDSALEQMALAWSRLQKISIIQYSGSYVSPNITLRGLALLLKHCPDLSVVVLSDAASPNGCVVASCRSASRVSSKQFMEAEVG